jgi:multicomponent Na+:H+ antiporter subunit G
MLFGMSPTEWLTFTAALIGVCTMLLASLGLLRLPDLYTRLHAATAARTLGLGALLLGVALYDGTFTTTIKMLAFAALFLLTTPIAAHLLGRTAYHTGVRPDEATHIDELAGRHPPR